MKEVDTCGEKIKLAVYSFKSVIYFLILFCGFIQSCKILKPNQYLLKSNIEIGEEYANKIKAKELQEHLNILASDDFEGRETTYPGQKKQQNF